MALPCAANNRLCVCVCVWVCVCVSAAQLCLTLCNPVDCSPPGLCPWNSPSRNTGVGCHALLQGIFPTQGSNLHLLQCVTRSPGEKKVMQMKSTGPGLERTFTVLEIFFSLYSVFLSFSSSPIFLGSVLSPRDFSSLHTGSSSLYKSTTRES